MFRTVASRARSKTFAGIFRKACRSRVRSEEHTSELQSHSDLPSLPTRRSSDLSKHHSRVDRRRVRIARARSSQRVAIFLSGSHRTAHRPGARRGQCSAPSHHALGQRPSPASSGKHAALGSDRKSTRLNSSHTVIYPLSLHDALPISRSTIRALIAAGFVSPERGPRSAWRFSFQDLIVLRTAQALAEANVPHRRITRSVKDLRRHLPESMPLSGQIGRAHV